ncbi:DUF2891 family protein [Gryllotalpicola ginsengisoli]|uniref:DUF2891 family protein n=1 Tax=Gryllotalpicola ginsengisoli TaxID=444608 RepID=UPI0003B51D4F|nr:DUF2891 family protein [Gryllotalpicola ginsengisoli]
MSPSDAFRIDRLAWAPRFAEVALENITRPYPYAAQHLDRSDDDLVPARVRHPIFGSSFDWHSSAHMHWLAVQLLDTGTRGETAQRLHSRLAVTVTEGNAAIEAAYLRDNPHYERPYGWAWALEFIAAVRRADDVRIRSLDPALAELAATIGELAIGWLTGVPEPVRHGVHANSAFGIRHLRAAAFELGDERLAEECARAARRWYGADRDWPFHYERSGQDFLSPGLEEALLMREVLPDGEFAEWAAGFFGLLEPDSAVLRPATVLDPGDPQQSHLYGLDLSRASAAVKIASALAETGSEHLAALLRAAVPALLPAALEASVSDEYFSSHWLATFAWDAVSAIERHGI